MSDIKQELERLMEFAPNQPEPMAEIRRRARRRRTSRLTGWAVGCFAVLFALFIGGPLAAGLLPPADERSGPILSPVDAVEVPHGWETYNGGDVSFAYPPDWTVVLNDSEGGPVVSNRPLSEVNARTAALTRPDVSFSAEFPDDGVVVAVGGDRLVAVYTGDRPTIGGMDALGEELAVPAGQVQVRARFATISESVLRVGAFLGPDVPSDVWADIEQILGTIVESPGTYDDEPPPPPGGDVAAVEDADTEVTRVDGLVLRTGERCLTVGGNDPGAPPAGHDCELPGVDVRPDDLIAASTSAVGAVFDSGKTFAVARAGHRIARVEARDAHGLAVEAHLHDGWVLAVIEGRILQFVGYDEHGTEVAHAWLP